MGTSLDALIRNSLRGYIDDPEEIDELFTKLLNKKVSQFSGSEKENTLNLLRDLMDDFDMASDRNSELTYADMLCLTDGILNSPSYPILEVDSIQFYHWQFRYAPEEFFAHRNRGGQRELYTVAGLRSSSCQCDNAGG